MHREPRDGAVFKLYQPLIATSATVLGVYYGLLTVLHGFLLPEGVLRTGMMILAGCTAASFAVLRWLSQRPDIGLGHLQASVLVAALLVATNVSVHAHATADPQQVFYLPLASICLVLLSPGRRTAWGALAIVLAAAVAQAPVLTAGSWLTPVVLVLTATIMGAVAADLLARLLDARLAQDETILALIEQNDRARAEAAREAARAEAASKAKSTFLANMSHELRTPLNGIIAVSAALRGSNLPPREAGMVDLIAGSGATLERLVSSVLDFSKIEAEKLELEDVAFDLRTVLDVPASLVGAHAEAKGLSFSARYGPDAAGTFSGDPTRLQQIITNLLSNAVKFTETGSVRLFIDWSEATGLLDITVRDTGIGIPDDVAGRLFDRFSQAESSINRRFGGTGLGLAIVRGLVDLMGGDIGVESKPGQGTVFSVSIPLPRAEGVLAAPDEAATLSMAVPDGSDEPGLRVLVAEDHPTNQKVVQLILEPLGVDVVIVPDGAQALTAWRGGHFDLVLMDMQMPVMDGLEAIRLIRAEETARGRGRTPIIMLTANAMTEHKAWSLDAGADLHVAKPFTPDRLIGAIEEALALAEEADTAIPGPDLKAATGF